MNHSMNIFGISLYLALNSLRIVLTLACFSLPDSLTLRLHFAELRVEALISVPILRLGRYCASSFWRNGWYPRANSFRNWENREPETQGIRSCSR